MSAPDSLPTILFCGKHRVNFAMFAPVYRLLREEPGVRILLSSGRYRRWPVLGWRDPRERQFCNERVFGEFGVDPQHLIRTSHKDPRRDVDVYISSNVDQKMMPPNSRLKTQMFQGVSFRNFAVNPKYLRFDKLFFIGRYHLEQYIARGWLREDDPRIELTGMPKLDRLVDGSIQREEVLREFGLDPARPTVLWCPTGARHNGFEQFGHAGQRAIEARDVNLIVKLHDHPHLPKGATREQLLEHARAGLGANGRLAVHSDVTKLLVAAELLVTDASSVAFEFCLLDRPIVFIDSPKLLAERAAMEHSAMDLETHGRKIGRVVATPEALGEAIVEELANPGALSARRRAAAEHLFHAPGEAGRRMAKRLIALARESNPVG